MATLATSTAETTGLFASVYAAASGDIGAVPWATGQPSQALVNWLNAMAPSVLRCGARICVPCCGLGDDAMAFAQRGYDVTAFDSSEVAVLWAQTRFAGSRDSFQHVDLFDVPARWRHRFDLVADVNNLHAFPPDVQDDALKREAELLSPHGRVLVICQAARQAGGADEQETNTWPMSENELIRQASLAGLTLSRPAAVFDDDETDPPTPRLRALLERA